MEVFVVRSPRPGSKSPPRRRCLSRWRREEQHSQWQVADPVEDEVDEWQGQVMRWLRESRMGRWLCLMAVLLVRLLVLLLIVWLVSFLHTGLGLPCFLVLLSLWVYGEKQHAAFSGYLRHLCEMAHGPSMAPPAQ
ncbi:hypothetical protein AALO_G00245030 [Alosa alosa]|uniref:SAYSvFN domain-containing protein n=1 Tax=Alosa alosa TaxID=278164 RepID=A0AAV6FX05_9TELE|nr:hypothetical protein AALO_G00245030 [Alosa alosa]